MAMMGRSSTLAAGMARCSIISAPAGGASRTRGFDISETMIQAALGRHARTGLIYRGRVATRASRLRRGERHLQREARTRTRRLVGPRASDAGAHGVTLPPRVRVQHADESFGSGQATGGSLLRRSVRVFDVCRQRFSPRVALLHDYPLYEFTIIVRM